MLSRMNAKKSKTGSSSRKKTRDPERTRAHILNVAFMEIFRHGYQGVSVDQIVEKTGLTKGAFFHHFPTKRDLAFAHIDETLMGMTLERWIHPLAAYKNPVEGIWLNLQRIIDESNDKHLELGCPLNNLIQEMSAVDPVFREKLGKILSAWIDGVRLELERARRDGYLRKNADVRRLAEFVVMGHEGAYGLIKILRSKEAFRSLQASLKASLETFAT